MVLALVGGLLAAGFAIDVLRMTGDAGQLKRATDAAALALGREYIRNSKDFDTVGPTLAGDYVRANLGAGSDLKATLEDVGLTKTVSGGNTILEVAARFTSQPTLSGQAPHAFTIRSAAEVHVGSIEVALVLPFTVDISRASMTVLTNLGKTFASDLMRDDAHVYVSVVPYYQRVNVYDAKRRSRIRSWPRPEGLKPRELTNIGAAPVAADPAADTLEQNFFEQTGIPDLASDKTPDLQTDVYVSSAVSVRAKITSGIRRRGDNSISAIATMIRGTRHRANILMSRGDGRLSCNMVPKLAG